MKNQYFGDVRDLFKYDLIQRVLQEITPLKRLSFIPMLTRNKLRREGNKRDFNGAEKAGRPGTKNKRLINFLNEKYKVDVDKRDFTEIKTYFKSEGIGVGIYKGHEYFNHETRGEYFENIPEDFLRNSLVFVDPDIGLEIKNSGEEHLLYQDVKNLYGRMDEDSILMIYQHFPQAQFRHEEYSPKGRSNDLRKFTRCLPIYISDNEIFFLFLAKNDELKNQLARIVSKYKRDYPKRITTGNAD